MHDEPVPSEGIRAPHPFQHDPEDNPEEPTCEVCGLQGEDYGNGIEHVRLEDD